MKILVVDDHSRTAPKRLSRSEMQGMAILFAPRRETWARAAYIRGMSYALSVLKSRRGFRDGCRTFSHKPEDVPRMVSALDEGNDFLIRSRYIRGGTIPEEWSFFSTDEFSLRQSCRKIPHRNLQHKDCTAGFPCDTKFCPKRN